MFLWRASLREAARREPVVVTLEPPPARPLTPPPKRGRAAGRGGERPASPPPAMGDLGIGAAATEDGSGDGGGAGSGEGGTLLGRMRHTSVYDRLYQAIDQALTYPRELQEAGIEGDVRVTLVFSSEGRFLRGHSAVTATSPYLRVVVMRVLRRVLAQPLRSADSVRARTVFVFDLQRKLKNGSGTFGDNLGFYRTSTPVVNPVRLGPLVFGAGASPSHLTGSAPGVSAGVSIDPDWIVDRFRRDSGIDPLEAYRRDPDWR